MAGPRIPNWITYVLCIVFGGAVAYIPLNQQNVQLSRQVVQLQQQIYQLNAQRSELAKQDLPVRIGSRKPFLGGGGRVLIIQNLTNSDLPITATFGRTGAPSQTRELVVRGNGTEQIGEAQGWQFADGDSVRLSNPKYRDWSNPNLVFN